MGDLLGEEVVVATTRVETMLGDTAVAVHPQDQRYQVYENSFIRLAVFRPKFQEIYDVSSFS